MKGHIQFRWKVIRGLNKVKGTVSLTQNIRAIEAQNGSPPTLDHPKNRDQTAFYVVKGLAGKGVSFIGWN